MAQQTNIWGKMVSGTAGAAVGMKRAAHNAKQDGKVEDARKHISALTYEIGRLTVCGMDRGTAFEGPVAERYRKIQEAREEIRAFEAEKQRTKAVCPHCGEKVIAGLLGEGQRNRECRPAPELAFHGHVAARQAGHALHEG